MTAFWAVLFWLGPPGSLRPDNPMLEAKRLKTVLSFGGGVQTTAMVVLIKTGEIAKPDAVVFADTGCEWPETWDYLARYTRPLLEEMGIPFVVVRHRETLMDYFWRYQAVPMVSRRSCTQKFKLGPLSKLFGSYGEPVVSLVGFSQDEQGRASRTAARPIRKCVSSRFSLIDLGLSRADCGYEIERFGWPVPRKSSCICCPYQHPARIGKLFREHPGLFEQVALLEENSTKRYPGSCIIIGHPWRTFAQQQAQFDGEWDYGCGDGYCMH